MRSTVLVTGCSDGSLGSELCIAFQQAGWRVFATARNLAKLERMRSAGIEILELDTLSEESVRKCVSEVERLTATGDNKLGSLDMLVNNAGGGYSMPILDLDLAKARHLFDLNVLSIVITTKSFLPLLRASVRGGVIANNTSTSGLTACALPFAGAYNATKAAAVNLTETMRLELEPFGIKVINLMTGAVRSTFFANLPAPVLPPESLYQLARQPIEASMAGQENATEGMPADQWARKVVNGLNKSRPSYWIWAGAWVVMIRIWAHFYIGFPDFVMKPRTGLDVFAKKLDGSKSNRR